jgi:pyrroloquinoline quinone (PQQ) biosynthesis protein C
LAKVDALTGSLHVDGIMTEAEHKVMAASLFAVEKQNGEWNVVSLSNWTRYEGQPDDT